MDIWIIQNGEKTGPIHDFEVRKKIEAGELAANTPAWHEGLPAWKPLIEIGLFEREFDKPFESQDKQPFEAPEPKEESYARWLSGGKASEIPAPPPPMDRIYSLRRFWARWFDLNLFAAIWFISMWALGRDIGSMITNIWILAFFYVPWFALETVLLHRFGFTPGKWLLGIKVMNNDGSLLELPQATHRSVRVLFIGIGFGLDFIALVCQIMAYFTTKRIGKPLWDQAGGHRISVSDLQPLRVAALVAIMFGSIFLKGLVIMPYGLEEMSKKSPELKKYIEEHPPWQLPKRH